MMGTDGDIMGFNEKTADGTENEDDELTEILRVCFGGNEFQKPQDLESDLLLGSNDINPIQAHKENANLDLELGHKEKPQDREFGPQNNGPRIKNLAQEIFSSGKEKETDTCDRQSFSHMYFFCYR